MSYEIPKNLKYEEKFFFNLSLSQAGYLGIFGAIGAMIFLKTPLPFEIKAVLALLFAGIGGGFPRNVAMTFVVNGTSDTKNSISNVRRYEWGVSRFIRWVKEECVIQALPINAKLMM